MSKWKIYTPEGMQDILFEDCFIKRGIEGGLRNLFRTYGYFEIESPTLEFYDTFSAETDLTPQETMFKFFDQQGRILVLRPEMTIPVARIAATKYKDMQYPLRFSYIGNAFRFNEMGGGKQKEFTQAGVEMLGVSTPESDAEVISVAVNAMKKAGIENFQIDIGQVEFFKGLMEETGFSEQDIEQLRVLIDCKDFIGIEEKVKCRNIPVELKDLILELPKLFGARDVIVKVRKITSNKRSLKALDNLGQVLGILEEYGLDRYVSVDLGMVQSLNYYTGIIFRGFTYGVGFPILSGGRYDNLVEKFGKICPATGFSLGINMAMTALERQKNDISRFTADSLISYTAAGRKTAFDICQELREQGLIVEMDVTGDSFDIIKKYALDKGIEGIIHITGSEGIEVHNLKTGSISKTSISGLVKGAAVSDDR